MLRAPACCRYIDIRIIARYVRTALELPACWPFVTLQTCLYVELLQHDQEILSKLLAFSRNNL